MSRYATRWQASPCCVWDTETPGAPRHLSRGLSTSGLWRAAADGGCLPPQELIQPGECSLRGEQSQGQAHLHGCLYLPHQLLICYIFFPITPEFCFIGLSKLKKEKQKTNQPKTQEHPTSLYLHNKLGDSLWH